MVIHFYFLFGKDLDQFKIASCWPELSQNEKPNQTKNLESSKVFLLLNFWCRFWYSDDDK